MSAAAIRAGKAWVELSVQDKLDAGLRRAQQKLLRWGQGLATIGTATAAVGAGLLAMLGSAASAFADAGSELYDLSQQTGVSAETLSSLGFAADQSGASLEDVSSAMRGLSRFSGQVAKGSKTATDSLAKLGISASDFLAADAEQRLAMIADGLSTISDPLERGAVAMDVLGRSGQKLAPLLAGGAQGLADLRAEAEKYGQVISQDQAEKADALGDAWNAAAKAAKSIKLQIGAALADALIPFFETLALVAGATVKWIKQNQFLVKIVGAVALGITLAGVAILGMAGAAFLLAGVIQAATIIMAAFNAVLAFTAAFVAALFSPLGLAVLAILAVVAAVAVGVVWFLRYTQMGQQMVATVSGYLGLLWSIARQTFGGIADAIAAGNLALAGKIAMAGLNVAWQLGIATLKGAWEGFKVWLVQLFAGMFTAIFGRLQQFQQGLVDRINSLRSQLGMDPIKGFAAIDSLANVSRAAGGMAVNSAKSNRDKALAAAFQEVAKAQVELSNLAAQAATEKKQLADARAKRMESLGDGLDTSDGLGGSTSSDSAQGTFNAAIAGLLGRSGDSAAEKTAANTGAMKDDIAAMREKLEAGLLEAEE